MMGVLRSFRSSSFDGRRRLCLFTPGVGGRLASVLPRKTAPKNPPKPLVLPTIVIAVLFLATASADAQPQPPEAGQLDVSHELKDLERVGFQQFVDISRVFIRTTEPVRYTVDTSRPEVIAVVLENTGVSVFNNRRFLDTRFFNSAVSFVEPKVIEGPSPSVRIEIRVRRPVAFREIQNDTLLAFDFPR